MQLTMTKNLMITKLPVNECAFIFIQLVTTLQFLYIHVRVCLSCNNVHSVDSLHFLLACGTVELVCFVRI